MPKHAPAAIMIKWTAEALVAAKELYVAVKGTTAVRAAVAAKARTARLAR